MVTRRQERVSERIHHEISDLLQNEIRDPRLAYVTVTGVEISPDLQLATVFVTALGDHEAKAAAMTALEGAVGYIRRELAQRLQMRVTPAVRFVLDESWERGARLDALLDSLRSLPPDDALGLATDDDEKDAA
jgi:ribosome-binding factor A